jgi:hypothetical protein
MAGTDLSSGKIVVLDLRESDRLAVGIHIESATGTNLIDFEESVDGINYAHVCSLTITDPGTTIWHIHPVFSRWKKISYIPGTGGATFTVHIVSRVDSIGSRGVGPVVSSTNG